MVQSEYGSVVEVIAPSAAHHPNSRSSRKQMVAIGLACLLALAVVIFVTAFGDQWGDTYGEPFEMESQHTSHEIASAILRSAGTKDLNPAVPKSIAESAEEAAKEVQDGLKPTVKLAPIDPKLEKMLKQAQAEIDIEHEIAKKKAAAKKQAKLLKKK